MSRDRWPKPNVRPFHVEFNRETEKAALTAERVVERPLRRRRITVGRQVYVAFSAHEVIQAESDRNQSRPGWVA